MDLVGQTVSTGRRRLENSGRQLGTIVIRFSRISLGPEFRPAQKLTKRTTKRGPRVLRISRTCGTADFKLFKYVTYLSARVKRGRTSTSDNYSNRCNFGV